MTRDDIRKLIGGYATGSLTESERKLLFEAALDDQELFDEIVHEQSLKELIDEPGARERLIAALDSGKPERVWWRQPWPWAAAAALCLGVVLIVAIQLRPSKPPEIVAVAQPAAPPPVALAENKPLVKEPPKRIPVAKEKRLDEKDEDRRVPVEPPAAAPASKTEVAVTAVLPAPPPPAQAAAPLSSQAQQQTLESGPRQSRFAAPAGIVGGARSVAMKAVRFAFNYRIEPDRSIAITVAGDGYLRVEAPAPISIPNEGRVLSGSTTRLKIPQSAQELTITFAESRAVVENAVADRLSDKKDADSGTVEDPNPSANSRLVVTVRVPK